MPVVRKINSKNTYSVRHDVLRKGKPIESSYFNGDDDKTTTHFGLFLEENIIGIVSVYKVSNPIFTENIQFQIRGMAVLSEFQGKGFGEQLLKEAEKYCLKEQADLIWFNAREKAISFYKKSGYEIIGKSFDIPNVGIHFVMHKKS